MPASGNSGPATAPARAGSSTWCGSLCGQQHLTGDSARALGIAQFASRESPFAKPTAATGSAIRGFFTIPAEFGPQTFSTHSASGRAAGAAQQPSAAGGTCDGAASSGHAISTTANNAVHNQQQQAFRAPGGLIGIVQPSVCPSSVGESTVGAGGSGSSFCCTAPGFGCVLETSRTGGNPFGKTPGPGALTFGYVPSSEPFVFSAPCAAGTNVADAAQQPRATSQGPVFPATSASSGNSVAAQQSRCSSPHLIVGSCCAYVQI